MSDIAEQAAADYSGRRVVILGMARQGLALARYFLSSGAHVTLSDVRPAEELSGESLEMLEYVDASGASGRDRLSFALGGHPSWLLDSADCLCLSGGVSPSLPIVREAAARGVPPVNDAQLTLQQCPVPVIGITGSAGKTTTATLTSLMLRAQGFTTHIGGNIGMPLIDRLETIRVGDRVVLELSSFQLELCRTSPALAVVLNITPNHLDRHSSMSQYAASKANILRYQGCSDICVLNADDPYTGGWLKSGTCRIEPGEGQEALRFPLAARTLGFSLLHPLDSGAYMADGRLWYRSINEAAAAICRVDDVPLRGRHNLANILAAACAAGSAGAQLPAMRDVAATFRGVEHRLEIVTRRKGVLWVNDSIATAPERTIAAMESFSEPIVLLAGGRDKHLPWDEMARVTFEKVRHVVLFGEAAGLIGEALAQQPVRPDGTVPAVTHCVDLPEAVAVAESVAWPGDVVLLSPGGTSFDAYRDFVARGEHFRSLVEELT